MRVRLARLRERVAGLVGSFSTLLGTPAESDLEHPERHAARAFLLLAIPVGLLFVFLIPPSQVVDEETHFLRSWQLSELNLVTDVRFDEASGLERNGAVFDVCVVEYIGQFGDVAASPSSFSPRSFWFDTPDCSPRSREYRITDAGTGYGPWSYPGQVAMLSGARAVGLPLPIAFYLGRIGGLAVFIGLVWTALKLSPRARLTMMFVALLPMSMMSAAAYSSDGIMIGGAILATACVLRLAAGPTVSERVLLGAFVVVMAAVIATKPPYAVLLGLLLLIPPDRFGSVETGRRFLAGAAVLPLLPALIWSRVGSGADSPVFYADADPAAQARGLLRDPLDFPIAVWNTLVNDFTQEVFLSRGWVGVFGMFRVGRPEVAPLLPVFFVLLATGALIATIVVEGGTPREGVRRSQRFWRQGVAYGVLVAGFSAMFLTGYVMWTVPGAYSIEGVQGRYLLPFLPLAAVAPALVRSRSTARFSIAGVSFVMVILTAGAVHRMIALFY